MIEFKPKLLTSLKNYSKETFMSDLMAGIIVGIVALPLAIAFAIASGVPPEKGIITAIIAGFIIAVFGGTKVQIGGPTGAFIIIIYGIIQDYGTSGLIAATLIAGILLIAMGVFRLGTIIKFIPYPIIVGFTSGIAVTIFTTQIGDAFGLNFGGEVVPADFISKWVLYFKNIQTLDPWNLAISTCSVGLILITPRFSKKIPGSLIAIIVMTVIAFLIKRYLGVESISTIGDRFSINAQIPTIEMPSLSWVAIKNLFPVAIVIAVLGAIESLLSATVADGVTGEKHNANTELIAQGIANVVTPLFGGIPATGAIARTMTNINNGGKTPIAGIIHAIVLLLIYFFLMDCAQYIPMSCLAGVLIIVAYNMSEWRTFKSLLKNPRADVIVLLVTFLLTVIFDLVVAIQMGLVVAALMFMKRVAETTSISVTRENINLTEDLGPAFKDEKISIPTGVEVYEIDGPYFFGIANKFEEQMVHLEERPNVRILRMRKVPFIDSTGIHNLSSLCRTSQREHITIVLSGVNPKVNETLKKAGFYDILGQQNICSNIYIAIERAKDIITQIEEKKTKKQEDVNKESSED